MSEPKGIDDLLVMGRSPRRLCGAEVDRFLTEQRERQRQLFVATESPLVPQRDTPQRRPLEAQLEPMTSSNSVVAHVGDDDRPPFPIDVFPPAVSQLITQGAAAIACAPDYIGTAILAVASGAIGASRSIQVKPNHIEPPVVFAVLVGAPGQAKTPALKLAALPIVAEQSRRAARHQDEKARFREQMAQLKSRPRPPANQTEATQPQEPPPMSHLYTSDMTMEALGALLGRNPRGVLVFRDEIMALVYGMNQYRKGVGGDRQGILSAWSCESVKIDRVNEERSLFIPHPFISIIGGIQPDLMGKMEAHPESDDGFLDRFLFSFPAPRPVAGYSDVAVDDEITNAWDLIIQRLLSLQPMEASEGQYYPRRVHFTSDGREAYKAFCNCVAHEANQPDFPEQLAGMCIKMKAYCARIALIVRLLRWATDVSDEANSGTNCDVVVDACDVRNAIRLCDYFKQHSAIMHGCLRESAEAKKVRRLLAWMNRKQILSCTVREVTRAQVGGVSKAFEAFTLLTAAAERGHGMVSGEGSSLIFTLVETPK